MEVISISSSPVVATERNNDVITINSSSDDEVVVTKVVPFKEVDVNKQRKKKSEKQPKKKKKKKTSLTPVKGGTPRPEDFESLEAKLTRLVQERAAAIAKTTTSGAYQLPTAGPLTPVVKGPVRKINVCGGIGDHAICTVNLIDGHVIRDVKKAINQAFGPKPGFYLACLHFVDTDGSTRSLKSTDLKDGAWVKCEYKSTEKSQKRPSSSSDDDPSSSSSNKKLKKTPTASSSSSQE